MGKKKAIVFILFVIKYQIQHSEDKFKAGWWYKGFLRQIIQRAKWKSLLLLKCLEFVCYSMAQAAGIHSLNTLTILSNVNIWWKASYYLGRKVVNVHMQDCEKYHYLKKAFTKSL